MLTLYYRPTCPYCQRVLGEAEANNIKLNLKDITDQVTQDELVARGGKKMVPYLVDEDKGVEMYESGDIVEYLNNNYAKTSNENGHDGEICESCQ